MRKNLKAHQVREALIVAGLEIVLERGIDAALNVSLTEAVERAGVPRSSAYASLEGAHGTPLSRFHLELLTRLDLPESGAETLAEVEAVLTEEQDRLLSTDPKERAYVMRQIIRRAVRTNLSLIVGRTHWRIFTAVLAASGTQPDPDPLHLELQSHASTASSSFAELYTELFSLFGVRLASPYTMDAFGAVAFNLVDAIALRIDIDRGLADIERPTGPNGELQTWTAAAVAFEGLVLAYTEPDPDAPITADLSGWQRH